MKLYLVQHGQAQPKPVDPDRPLTDQGREDVERLAVFLGRSGVEVGRVLHSGKLRAAQTAAVLAKTVAPQIDQQVLDGIKPKDEPGQIDWDEVTAGADTLVVGHMPYLGRLVALLVAGQLDKPITAYQPGTAVCLEGDDEGGWQIEWMITPALLSRG